MNDASKPFAFSQFVPGFDFLRNLASGAASSGAGAVPGMPSLANWVAPTMSVEEVDKRIQELKTVQYWLEQNGHALKATIQALEVQKMTLSTLRGMNVRMEDLASAFTRVASAPVSASAPQPAPASPPATPAMNGKDDAPGDEAPEAAPRPAARKKAAGGGSAADGSGAVVDPLQWWGALTQQFQQIAASALQDASHVSVPGAVTPASDTAGKSARPAAAARKKAAVKAPARKRTRTR